LGRRGVESGRHGERHESEGNLWMGATLSKLSNVCTQVREFVDEYGY